jgi:enoyl-CoA hydratase/carnithine racemase
MKALTSHHTVSFQKEGHVMVVTIGPPIVGGHVSIIRLPDELRDFRTEVGWEEETRVIILTGSDERSFSIGGGWIKGFLREGDGQQQEFWSIAEPVAKLDRPVIAAISGDAIGQGLELALGCDIRIAAETSHFGLPHIKTGFIPYDGGTQRLSRLVGRGKTFEMILTGEIIDAQEALQVGLVNKVVPKEELMSVAMVMAKEMASKGPIALRCAKEAIHKGMDMTLAQGLRLEADLYLLIHTSKDRTEGIRAFREKRAPKFEGK